MYIVRVSINSIQSNEFNLEISCCQSFNIKHGIERFNGLGNPQNLNLYEKKTKNFLLNSIHSKY
jgi:hypothetical protein